ncbi:MAG: hypothetical protein QOJ65_468 [Fimbriimonadaceae bacterium]|nr:hypothetical protein [Fimbriimonadaceae bacterium]
MNEPEFRNAIREILFDAARHRAGERSMHDHGWMDQATAHAVERLAHDWNYTSGMRTRDELVTDVHARLSTTDNALLRALDPERLADSLMKVEEAK